MTLAHRRILARQATSHEPTGKEPRKFCTARNMERMEDGKEATPTHSKGGIASGTQVEKIQ